MLLIAASFFYVIYSVYIGRICMQCEVVVCYDSSTDIATFTFPASHFNLAFIIGVQGAVLGAIHVGCYRLYFLLTQKENEIRT